MHSLINKIVYCVCFYLLVITVVAEEEDDSLIIETLTGKVRGKSNVVISNGKEVEKWSSIPYAEKPIGNLRFAHPRPIKRWDGIYDATENPNSCIQSRVTETTKSEDCLYLSIVVPKPRPKNATVMIWLYGGALYGGSLVRDTYDYDMLATEKNVILASMQYRTNGLGFMYFGTDSAPGNPGLYDQLMAMEWIHDNIEFFGGNPNDITIFGQSAGSTSVSIHTISPLSKGLFTKSIMQSGTINDLIRSKESVIESGLNLAREVGCLLIDDSSIDFEKIVDCMKSIDAEKLIGTQNIRAIVDGKIIPENPMLMVENHDFNDVSILLGVTSEEGLKFLLDEGIIPKEENYRVTRSDFLNAVEHYFASFSSLAKESIINTYTNWLNVEDSDSNRLALNFLGDYRFESNANYFGEKYVEAGNDVYKYYYTHIDDVNGYPDWSGSKHGDEVKYTFGYAVNNPQNFTKQEIELSRRIMTYWTNFAKTGNPNTFPNGSHTDVYWPKHTLENKEYLILDTNTSEIGYNLRPHFSDFWNYDFPKLL